MSDKTVSKNKLNCCRYFAWPFFIWTVVFFVVFFLGIKPKALNLSKKCSNASQVLLPIDVRACFGFFTFNTECAAICVDECPNKAENIYLMKIIDNNNRTLGRDLLKQKKICDMSNITLIENESFERLIDRKICARVVANSSSDESLFPGLCFPLENRFVNRETTTLIEKENFTTNKEDIRMAYEEALGHFEFAAFYFIFTNLVNTKALSFLTKIVYS
jgi:hypothetical protein